MGEHTRAAIAGLQHLRRPAAPVISKIRAHSSLFMPRIRHLTAFLPFFSNSSRNRQRTFVGSKFVSARKARVVRGFYQSALTCAFLPHFSPKPVCSKTPFFFRLRRPVCAMKKKTGLNLFLSCLFCFSFKKNVGQPPTSNYCFRHGSPARNVKTKKLKRK